ncbi:MAG: PucR family transcriptional regulator [Kineosporiaceae bacterium]
MQEGVVSLRPRFGDRRLADLLRVHAQGRVGISATYGRLDDTSVALREARLACQTVTPRTTDVGSFEDSPVAVLLVSAPDAAANLARRVLGRVLDLPAADRGPLLETTRVWLAEDVSTSAAAQRLHLHRNGVRYRLNRFEELTGRRLGSPTDLADVRIALEAMRILGLG